MEKKPEHFEGKSALEHVFSARLKGKIASTEMHGFEVSHHLESFVISAKETAILFLLFWMVQTALWIPFLQIIYIDLLFLAGWIIWRVGSFAQFAWLKLERMNRLIQEERWEIEHHRDQEKEELKALYQAKGFSGKLLDEVVDVLMADDNRLLQVMLEEELGLTLHSTDHPLKQGLGAFLGIVLSACILAGSIFLSPTYGIFFGSFFSIGLCHYVISKKHKTEFLSSFIWNIAIVFLSASFIYFLGQLAKNLLS